MASSGGRARPPHSPGRAASNATIKAEVRKYVAEMLKSIQSDSSRYPSASPLGKHKSPDVRVLGRNAAGAKVKARMSSRHGCLIVLPKVVARDAGLVGRNTPRGFCVWDPMTGEIRCTQQD